jgi:hypothetical protein
MTTISPKVTCVPLPLTWLYFRGNKVAGNVVLEWSTTAEVNHSFFTLEKSNNGITFKTLVKMDEQTPNGSAKHVYTYTDTQPDNIGYYRIGQTDKDGKRSLFKTIMVRMNEAPVFIANQYIQGSRIIVQTTGAVPGKGSIRLHNLEGVQIGLQDVLLTKETKTYSILTPQQKGVYILSILSGAKLIYTAKVMVL